MNNTPATDITADASSDTTTLRAMFEEEASLQGDTLEGAIIAGDIDTPFENGDVVPTVGPAVVWTRDWCYFTVIDDGIINISSVPLRADHNYQPRWIGNW